MRHVNTNNLSLRFIEAVNSLIQSILVNKSLEVFTEEISSLFAKNFGIIGATCYVVKGNKLFLFSQKEKKILKNIFNRNFIVKDHDIRDKRILITKVVRENIWIQSNNLVDFFYPIYPKEDIEKIQRKLNAKLFIAFPLSIQKKVRGVFLISFKNKHVSEEELGLLKFFINLSSIAFDSSIKLQSLQKQYDLEKETTATLAHEFKKPLNITFKHVFELEMLIKSFQQQGNHNLNQEEIEKLYQIIIKNVESIKYLTNLTDSILTLHHLESELNEMTMHVTDLKNRLESLCIVYQQKAERKKLSLNYKLGVDEGFWYGNGIQLEQVLSILLDNAVKYTMQGSIHVEIKQMEKYFNCCVIDTGLGIPKAKRKIIFEKFYKNHNIRGNGIGLGLYMAKKIVELLDGTITVEDNPRGQGTKFSVKVPLFAPIDQH